MSVSAVYDALVSSTLVHEFESAIMQATGLSVELTPSSEPTELFQFHQGENPFCSLMTQFRGSCTACQQVHTDLRQRIAENLTPQVIRCFAGLVEFAVPVVVGGQHVATLLGGQVLQSKPTQTQLARLIKQLRAWEMQDNLRQVKTALLQTPVISKKQFEATVRLLTIFASFLAEDVDRNLLAERVHDAACITSAKNFIRAHASEPLRLGDVAQHLHVSPHYFCKFFKKSTGTGFSKFLGLVRVEIAKNLLANSFLLINEVANRSGFGSLSQFNRAFRRDVGCSPRAYRASLLQASDF